MGFYKKQLSTGPSRRRKGIQVEGLKELQLKIGKVQGFASPKDKRIKAIHKRRAMNLSRQLKRRVKPAKQDITVWGRGRPLVVEKGTLKRSIGYWQPKDSRVNHVYMIGARTGSKVGEKRDAWFQLIVEQDAQYIDGNNRHAGLLQDFLRESVPKLRAQLAADYKAELKKLAK